MKDNKTKNKIIGISIGILVVLLVVISSTYAYWQITKSQQDPNGIIAACLDFNVDFPVGISKDNAWPISDSEGMNLEGYTFTVTNNCDTDVNYVIGLESVTSDGIGEYLSDASIALAFDNELLGTYDKLSGLQGPSTDARGSKELRTATLKGNSTNNHNLKLWIDEESDVSEQGRGFAGKLFITGGQDIENDNPVKPLIIVTPEEAFTFKSGEIIGYNESYGTSVVIPSTIDGEEVTAISATAFKKEKLTGIINYNVSFDAITEINSFDETPANIIYVLNDQNKGQAIDFSNLLNNIAYAVSLTDDEEINATLQGLSQSYNIPVYNNENMPQNLELRQFALYAVVNANMEMEQLVGGKYADGEIRVVIDELDLSQAYNLELIEPGAFSNYDSGITRVEEFEEQIETKPVSLTKLTFGENEQPLEIGWGAFNGIDVDNLVVYSNMFGSATTKEGYANEGTIGFFAGANVNNMQVKYVEGYPVVGEGSLFSYMNINEIYVEEGITELATGAFANEWNDCVVQEINLPSTINKIGYWSLIHIKTINFIAGHCNNVQIDSRAWYEDSMINPNTCTLGQNTN